MNLFKNALTLLVGNTSDISYLKMPRKKSTTQKHFSERELIKHESDIGRDIFGEIPKGHRREFFCLDEKTCIWYEEFKNKEGKPETITTRYEIQGDKIMKVQQGARYSYLEGTELDNLLAAVDLYYERVMRSVYNRDPQTGQQLA